jgi:hypothetical protein
MPRAVRRSARRVPADLGFPNASWHDYAHLEPVLDLPGMAASGEGLAGARFAHHCGGFWGLTRDRAVDGQTTTPIAVSVERALLEVWARACGSPEARRIARRSERAWTRERRVRRRPRRELDEYVHTSWWKVSWFAVATTTWLARKCSRRALRHFVRGVVAMMLALQLADDAADHREDQVRYGRGVATQLGCSRWALARAAGLCFRQAANHFRRGHFATLSSWNAERAARVRAQFEN